ncbi:hypothetical protein [Hyphomicrobium sp.]|uniref:hypothetical protein n=1 Tax=Hyphomicrobium sp. TaxID=82 RepID=UPI002FDF37FC
MFEDGLIVALILMGLMALFVVRRAFRRSLSARRFKQSGNVFFMLFGAVAIAGLIGVSTMTTMKGPTRGITHSNQVAAANNTLYTTARMIAGAVQDEADCDSDGIVEPPPWRDAGGLSAPSGGGLVPTDLGATQRDPWGSDIGYCAWDHGRRTVTHDVATCGGAGANRLVGVDSKSEYVIAVISAGPDRTFQTTCHPWVDADDDGVPDAPLIVTPAGSDDIVRAQAITALFAEGTTNQLQQLPDDACTPDAIGTLRYDAGTMQVCRDGGWQEVGSAIQVSGSFLPVTGAQLNSEHTTSNGISFTGFFGTRTASVDGGAVLIVNGVEQGNTASIVAGDTIELKATAAGAPATASTFTLSVSTLRRAWTITTRDPTPPVLVMTPASNNAMNVTGPGSPAHGATVRFTVRNSGETPTVALGAAQLSNTTNFAFDASGANVGDACQGQVLAYNATCFIDVRPRATDDGTYNGTLSIAAGSVSDDSSLSGTATGWTCTANQDVSWSPGCTALSGAVLANGANRTITNTNSSYDGTRVITCTDGTLVQSGGNCVETATCGGGGYPYDGYCYYYANAGQNCDTVCSSRGGCNLAGTIYIGSGAPNHNRCVDVLTALRGVTTSVTTSASSGHGCNWNNAYPPGRRRTVSTVCAGSHGNIRRACACNELDTTPDAFAFTDQTDVTLSTTITSNTVTISGINTGTTVSVSGHTSARISINGGSWVTSGTISNNQTLRVQLTSSASFSTALSATVNVGGVTDSWSVTTRAANGCSNTTMSWAPGCSAPSGAMTHGQTKSVNNTASGYDGTRNLSCSDGTISQSGGSCTSACGGFSYGGYCYYGGGNNESCDTVCSGRGGCNLAGLNYIGPNGTNEGCTTVLSEVLLGGFGTAGSTSGSYGCHTRDVGMGGRHRIRHTAMTSCGGRQNAIFRACACNN